MKLKIILLITGILLSKSMISQETIGSGGGFVADQSIAINWTVGDVISTNESILLVEGINQPNLTIVSEIHDPHWNPNITIGPNPFTSIIYIKNLQSNNYTLSVYTINGKIIYHTYLKTSEIELNFSGYAIGTYIFELTDNQGRNCVYKVLKK